ncbi:hypothetical protein TNCV_1721991 [Trichonephila clavipes]|nr:hypothetical protein TNCV_1721991 [Trichonephila clavipes]
MGHVGGIVNCQIRTPQNVARREQKARNAIQNVWHDSDEDLRLSESDCEESGGSADVIDNIPVNPDVYISRDGTE